MIVGFNDGYVADDGMFSPTSYEVILAHSPHLNYTEGNMCVSLSVRWQAL